MRKSNSNYVFFSILRQTMFSKHIRNNESIFFIFTTLKCVHFVLQFRLNMWKLYVIVDWYVTCVIIVRCWNVLKWFWRMFRLKIKIKYWLNLSILNNKIFVLIKILFDRSFASNEYIEHFFKNCVLLHDFRKFDYHDEKN